MGYEDSFYSLYQELKIIEGGLTGLPLHSACSRSQHCWRNALGRRPPENKEWSTISRPWVGSKYDELRLVVVGENLNECGGLNALVRLTAEAQKLISEGWRRIRFGNKFNKYPGSVLWHRVGCYAAGFIEKHELANTEFDNRGYPSSVDASSAYDFLAYLEHVKCSPTGSKSKPTWEMWENCGTQILRKELQLLAPDHIVVLGKSSNAASMKRNVFDAGWSSSAPFGTITKARGEIHGKPVSVYVVPHPTSYGGSSASIISDLRQALASE